ncbi:SixA phosphatase family protein [Alishewanella tabrizica]|uniref:Phosphohistidine phosphatase SixA n=1 Tax=Alishewanella tabrizica TaxID=671278 RepID=A0ABQ2WMP6_9ALTE|nr:histidine phosphatase family protein [Alishewanella tabrizica]GGW64444.1 hypothetical protein GCM10008111_20410 [Alishewanella tabrizica]
MSTLYFLRHATAEVILPDQDDRARCLIEKGKQQAAKVGQFMVRHDMLPQHVFTSPYPRASETAAIVCEQAKLTSATAVDWLALNTPPLDALEALQRLIPQLSAPSLFVGHEPDLSQLISRMLNAQLPLLEPLLKVRKASLTCLQLNTESTEFTASSAGSNDSATVNWCLQWSVPVKFM